MNFQFTPTDEPDDAIEAFFETTREDAARVGTPVNSSE
jgi:hypothetical protein